MYNSCKRFGTGQAPDCGPGCCIPGLTVGQQEKLDSMHIFHMREMQQIKSLLEEKKSAKAVEVLRYRADQYPRSADARVALGEAYLQSGQKDKARECFKQALALVPGHPEAAAKLKDLDSK